jgi:hypothetical protein
MEVSSQLYTSVIPGAHCIEAEWAPEPVWTLMEERKISCPYRESNLDCSVIQLVV